MSTKRYALRDDQWERIKHPLPGRAGTEGCPTKDDRLFVDAVLYRYRTGHPLTRSFLSVSATEARGAHALQSPVQTSVWKQIFEQMTAEADNEYAMIYLTIVRAHQHSAGALGR